MHRPSSRTHPPILLLAAVLLLGGGAAALSTSDPRALLALSLAAVGGWCGALALGGRAPHVPVDKGDSSPATAAPAGGPSPGPAPDGASPAPAGDALAGAPPAVETRLQDLAARQRSGTAELRRSIRDVIERLEEDEPPPPRRPKRARR
jgi:hypothetical protein